MSRAGCPDDDGVLLGAEAARRPEPEDRRPPARQRPRPRRLRGARAHRLPGRPAGLCHPCHRPAGSSTSPAASPWRRWPPCARTARSRTWCGRSPRCCPGAKVMAIQQVVKSRMEMLAQFTHFSYGISGVILFIGGLVVLVTMMGSVRERTDEIGIFRAVGFRRSHIMRIVFLEAGIISGAGRGSSATGWGWAAASAALSLLFGEGHAGHVPFATRGWRLGSRWLWRWRCGLDRPRAYPAADGRAGWTRTRPLRAL
ncbi:MAG: ABC transporter permease [Desulfobacterales bacterium]|nr:ABC transporter permease [Desulfobacterales bacterium]